MEFIPFDDYNRDDEFESTVGDVTGAVGGWDAYDETDFGGRQIETQRRGSVEWEGNDISEEDMHDIESLTIRLENSRKSRDRDGVPEPPSEIWVKDLEQIEIKELNTKLSTLWKDYVKQKLRRPFRLDSGGTFNPNTIWTKTDEGIFVEYRGEKRIQLTAKGNPQKFLSLTTISRNFGKGGTSFIRDILGVADYSSATKKTQQQADLASRSARDIPQIKTSYTGGNTQRVLESFQVTNDDMQGLATDLENDPIANQEEIRYFLAEQGQLKKLTSTFEQLVRSRNEKETELQQLKSKNQNSVSFTNPVYEGEDTEALLPFSDEDVEKIKELESEITELDNTITDQDAKVRNSLQRLRRSIENFIDSDGSLGSRVQELFRREGVTIASLITAIVMTITMIVESILLAIRSAVSSVTPSPKPVPPKPGPEPGPSPGPQPIPKPKTWSDWFKDQLRKIANLLLKLGDKALVALPGIIGAVVNFVLKSAGAVAGFLAEHLWAFALVVGGIIYKSVMDLYKKEKSKK